MKGIKCKFSIDIFSIFCVQFVSVAIFCEPNRKAEINSHPIFNNESSNQIPQDVFEDFSATSNFKPTSSNNSYYSQSNSTNSHNQYHSENSTIKTPVLSPHNQSTGENAPKAVLTPQQKSQNYTSLSHDLMSSLISNNLKQMGKPSASMEMTSSVSMPLNMNSLMRHNSPNTVPQLPRSPTLQFGQMQSHTPTLTPFQAPRMNSPSGSLSANPPSLQPFDANSQSYRSVNSPMFGIMRPMGPSQPMSGDTNVKALSKTDIDDLLN